MAIISINKYFKLLIIFLLIIIFDQISKALIVHNFELYQSIQIFPLFNITFIVNYGFAFGFLNNPSINQIIVSIVIFFIIIYFFHLLFKTQDNIFRFSLVLILSGAIGNFIDRLFRGYVVDFIDIYIFNYHWPAFNLADSSITIGFIVMMFNILFLNKKI
tara:strand:- start:2156 stop:2635 length:480 start_codon:yes stop_codon:yes gene_type:complete